MSAANIVNIFVANKKIKNMGKFDDVFNSLDTTEEVETTETIVETPAETDPQVEVKEEKIEETTEEKPIETEEQTIEETPAAEKKNWRERYAETPEYKEKLRKQDEAIYEAKLKKIEEIENNPVFQIVSKAIEQGIDPVEAMKKVAVDEISSLTPKDLFLKDLEKYKNSLTEEEIQEEIEKFESKSKLEQIKATEGIKSELTSAREAELAKFKTAKKEVTLDAETQAKVNKFDSDFEERLNALDGKTINGVKFTPAVLKKIEDTIASGDINPKLFIDEKGNFDADEAIELAILKHYRSAYVNGLKGEYKSEGFKEALKQKHNVGSGKTKTSGMPDATDPKAQKKAEIAFIFNK